MFLHWPLLVSLCFVNVNVYLYFVLVRPLVTKWTENYDFIRALNFICDFADFLFIMRVLSCRCFSICDDDDKLCHLTCAIDDKHSRISMRVFVCACASDLDMSFLASTLSQTKGNFSFVKLDNYIRRWMHARTRACMMSWRNVTNDARCEHAQPCGRQIYQRSRCLYWPRWLLWVCQQLKSNVE